MEVVEMKEPARTGLCAKALLELVKWAWNGTALTSAMTAVLEFLGSLPDIDDATSATALQDRVREVSLVLNTTMSKDKRQAACVSIAAQALAMVDDVLQQRFDGMRVDQLGYVMLGSTKQWALITMSRQRRVRPDESLLFLEHMLCEILNVDWKDMRRITRQYGL